MPRTRQCGQALRVLPLDRPTATTQTRTHDMMSLVKLEARFSWASRGNTMKKTLIVMRHGKAMRAEAGQQDADRALSEAGVMALEAQLPRMLRLYKTTSDTVALWASPTKRTN